MPSAPIAFTLVLYFVPMLLSLTVHEYCHAWSAHLLGDDTAKEQGRLTLNPLAHIDPIGTIFLPALFILTTGSALFGWARPVPINPARFRRDVSLRFGIAVSAAAGPLANLATGLLAALALGAMNRFGVDVPPLVARLLTVGMAINAGLAVFNLLPIPPLDGSRVLSGLLPHRWALPYARFAAFAPMILIAIFVLPGVSELIFAPAKGLMRLFQSLAGAGLSATAQ
jgi:Zn-dependent protease